MASQRTVEQQWRDAGDELGPAKVLFVRDPAVDLEGFVVVDNVACGPAIGGIRMAPDVTIEEVARLARAMTFKNAAAGLAHGGGKAGIVGDPALPAPAKERLVRAFGRAIRALTDYIPGPDMGTDEACMAYLHDEIGRAVGLPRVLGGIPLDSVGATGFGLAVCAEVAQEFAALTLRGARVAIQGFGAVGTHAARFLAERGALLVAAADAGGALVGSGGLDVERLIAWKRSGRSVGDYPDGKRLERDELVAVDCEIWIPAARPDVLRADNVDRLRAKLVLQGANIPATAEAEARLHARGILSVPDFIANAGGVICAAVEYHGGTQQQAFAVIEERIRDNTRAVLEAARRSGELPRAAAVALARARVVEAMSYRRADGGG
ncbi:MAG TPA: Glu/Leu/Phe/Val dehydrogenase dimerization domain-containing protein [Candidatus Dormibacteraeota bacterium]|nr:Glu/Leu/Phe/Val dehydrogenase dimerization domain-containing protein [Candidatus Dormibacteraeota bacterium]